MKKNKVAIANAGRHASAKLASAWRGAMHILACLYIANFSTKKYMNSLNRIRYKGYNFKVIKSGDITEIYAYQEELVKKFKDIVQMEDEIHMEMEIQADEEQKKVKTKKKEKADVKNEQEYFRRKSNIANTRKKLKRLIYANIGQYDEVDKFITLTFAGDSPTREQVVKEFREFKRRMQYKYGEKFEYLAVIERGERGTKRLHIHMVVFNLPYMEHKELVKIWKNGHVDIKKISDFGDVSDYLTKYIEKTLEDGYIDKGKRFYFPSQNLKKPVEEFLNDDEMYDYLQQVDIGNPLYEFSFDSKYVGLCNYCKFKIVK